MDMNNSTDTLRNMYDVIRILFPDWLMKLFIIMHGMEHKTLSINKIIWVHGHDKFFVLLLLLFFVFVFVFVYI